MEYYKKNEMIFYKLDTNQKTYFEVFNDGNSQKRVMKIDNLNLYNQLIQRIQEYSFEICSEQEFNDKLTLTLAQFR